MAGSLFVIAFLLLGITAFKGGELVYRYGLGVMSLPEVEGEGHAHGGSNGDGDHGKTKDHPDDDH
ncbi:MAG: hypothetical protein L3J52_09655 [Proteobacteria bacterium]|nr:hypothetical protein [Pseudomonadota bacterium]